MSKSKLHGAHHTRKSVAKPAGKHSAGLPLLGGLSAETFLRDYWQKKPLLIRGAIPNFKTLLTPDELGGLATEAKVSARLVLEKGGKRPWQVEHGPFAASRLAALPKAHWSLLVSNVEHWLEDAGLLLDRFNFVPLWRADDLMVSYAPPGGSVGAHVDSYDVFLLQGMGRRKWQIAAGGDRRYVPNVDLRILRKFCPEQEWELEPGDMLYLPPGVAHHGVAITDSMTYSVGFRAPTQRDLLTDFYNLPTELVTLLATDQLYGDPQLKAQANPGEISREALRGIADMLRGALESPEIMGRWFGRHVTKNANVEAHEREGRRPTLASVTKRLASDRLIWRSDHNRYAYFTGGDGVVYFYVDGDECALPPALGPLVQAICAKRCHQGQELKALLPRGKLGAQGLEVLRQMFAHGSLY